MTAIGKINKKIHPLLPHELPLLRRDFERLAEIQDEHSRLLGEAMQQSSETFHDNAPAEAVQNEQEVLMRRVKPIAYIIRNHNIIPYPEEVDESVAIGSRVGISINGNEPFQIDIVGYRDADWQDDDIDQVHHEAPLAASLLGSVVGQETIAVIGDVEKSVEVVGIDQVAVREYYADLLTAQTVARE